MAVAMRAARPHGVAAAIAIVVVIANGAGCGRGAEPVPGTAEDLAAYLNAIVGGDDTARRHEVGGWILNEPSWQRIVVEPYRGLWPAYRDGFAAAAVPLIAQLATRGPVSVRRHYAGDPKLSRAQGRLRWAVPTLYPSMVADVAGAPFDTVFVFDGARWRALAGLDDVVLAQVRALDATCAAALAKAGPTGHCTEVGAELADAALRGDRPRFAHACQLAANLCAAP